MGFQVLLVEVLVIQVVMQPVLVVLRKEIMEEVLLRLGHRVAAAGAVLVPLVKMRHLEMVEEEEMVHLLAYPVLQFIILLAAELVQALMVRLEELFLIQL